MAKITLENRMIGKALKTIDNNAEILEVGCGYCQKTEFLKSIGFSSITGVEKNPDLVDKAKKASFKVYTVEEFEEKFVDKKYDLIFMSHIIEHFQYSDLKEFIEHYLRYLKDDGKLLIATPVLNDSFFDDFDHVKPYSHLGLLSVFGEGVSQVQFYSSFQLQLIDIYYVRHAYQLKYFRSLELRTPLYRIPRIINQLLHLFYRLSFRIVGKPISWVGLFSVSVRT